MTETTRSLDHVAYVDTFFRELAPVWLDYVAALHGITAPPLDRPFTYMELGCGFGQSVITHAAAYPLGRFHACDINSLHIESAQRYADALGVRNVDLQRASFEQLLGRDLPAFDFIALHGVYSWVGSDARRAIVQFLRERLRPGGLAYVSYNCLPGWAVEMPLRRMLQELVPPREASIEERAKRAADALAKLADTASGYFGAHPTARTQAQSYQGYPAGYLAHEFLGEDWQAFYSIDVDDDMRRAGLSFVGSATLADNHPPLILGESAATAIAGLATPRQRRLAEDFATNRYFRRDVYVRADAASRAPSRLEEVVVARLADSIETSVRVPRGRVTFQDAFVDELAAALEDGPMAISSLTNRLGGARRSKDEILRNVTILVAAGALLPCVATQPFGHARVDAPLSIDGVGRAVLDYAMEHGVPRALPSRMLGNGYEVDPPTAVALHEYLAGHTQRDALALRIRAEVDARGWRGRTVANDADGSFDAHRAAATTLDETVPALVKLGVLAV